MGSKLDAFARKIHEKTNRNFLPFYKFPTGKTDLRIVPPAKGDDEDAWFLAIGQHYNVNDTPVYCPFEHEMNEDPCAICDFVAELRKDGMNDEANRMAVRRRTIVRAIVRGQEEKGPQIVNLPVTVFMSILEILKDTDTWGDILSPGPKGRDIRIIKTGQNLETKYQVQALPKTVAMFPTQAQVTELLDGLSPIASLVNVPTSAEVAAIVNDKMGYTAFGADADDEPADEVQEIPASDWDDEEEGDDTPPFEATDDSWLEDDDDTPVPSISERARKDQATTKASLTAELSKKHKVKGA
jgi:hypothetical protein